MRSATGTAFEPIGQCRKAGHSSKPRELHLLLSVEIWINDLSVKKSGNTANTVRP